MYKDVFVHARKLQILYYMNPKIEYYPMKEAACKHSPIIVRESNPRAKPGFMLVTC